MIDLLKMVRGSLKKSKATIKRKWPLHPCMYVQKDLLYSVGLGMNCYRKDNCSSYYEKDGQVYLADEEKAAQLLEYLRKLMVFKSEAVNLTEYKNFQQSTPDIYGYYKSENWNPILWALRLGTKKVADLGCGLGEYVNTWTNFGIDAIGLEFDPILVKNAKIPVIQQDITCFKREQLGGADTIYMWEPLRSKKLIEAFIANLKKEGEGLNVIHIPSGAMGDMLRETFKNTNSITFGELVFKV